MDHLHLKLVHRFAAVLALAALGGCDSLELPEAVNETVDKAKQAAIESVESVKHQVTATGSIKLVIDEEITTDACYASFHALQQGRPSILQIKSYQDGGAEFYPSVFVHAEVSATSPVQLSGQTYQATIFVQLEKDGALWCCSRDTPVELKIVSVSGEEFVAEITQGKVANTQTQSESSISGKFTGTFTDPSE